jgi:hypothetical protein
VAWSATEGTPCWVCGGEGQVRPSAMTDPAALFEIDPLD